MPIQKKNTKTKTKHIIIAFFKICIFCSPEIYRKIVTNDRYHLQYYPRQASEINACKNRNTLDTIVVIDL